MTRPRSERKKAKGKGEKFLLDLHVPMSGSARASSTSKLVQKVTGMAMRVPGEEKTAFVYITTR